MSFDVVWAGHDDDDPSFYRALEEYVSTRVWGRFREFGEGRAMGVVDDGLIIAVVIFNNYDDETGVIEISAAADSRRWLTKYTLKELFEYPFLKLKCQAVIARVDADNRNDNDRDLHRIFPAYGFKRYDIPRLRGRDKTEAIYVLSDDDWRTNRFNKGKYP